MTICQLKSCIISHLLGEFNIIFQCALTLFWSCEGHIFLFDVAFLWSYDLYVKILQRFWFEEDPLFDLQWPTILVWRWPSVHLAEWVWVWAGCHVCQNLPALFLPPTSASTHLLYHTQVIISNTELRHIMHHFCGEIFGGFVKKNPVSRYTSICLVKTWLTFECFTMTLTSNYIHPYIPTLQRMLTQPGGMVRVYHTVVDRAGSQAPGFLCRHFGVPVPDILIQQLPYHFLLLVHLCGKSHKI